MRLDFGAILPIIIGVTVLVLRRPFAEQIVRQQAWRSGDWRWEWAESRARVLGTVTASGAGAIVLGAAYLFRLWP